MTKLDFLIIGAQKSGTSSLRSFLGETQDGIFMPKRELHFWNRDGQYQEGLGLSSYLQNFSNATPNQIVGEKSPSYLPSESAPARIAKHFPEIKLIAILRDPIERAYSAFWHGKRVGAISQDTTFGESIRNYKNNRHIPYGDLVTQGFYANHLLRYLDYFPPQQLMVLDFKVAKQSPDLYLRNVLNFLLPNEIQTQKILDFPKKNVAKTSRKPRVSEFIHKTHLLNHRRKSIILKKFFVEFQPPMMLESDLIFLANIYKEENIKLETLTNINFNVSS